MEALPKRIFTGAWKEGHIQGIAVDRKRGFVYCSFTTILLKTDLLGNPIGSVVHLAGHLGCITLNEADGRVYGSLELKHDAIGKGITKRIGWEPAQEDAFYLVRFDTARINRMDMDAEKDGIMDAIYLRDVVSDYAQTDSYSGKLHRYGCSGIDGTGYGPAFGAAEDSEKKLVVAYGIYGDVTRTDNDYQVLLQYNVRDFDRYAMPLDQRAPHHSGPARYEEKYFFYTGNTTYGIQNLEYDAYRRRWLVAVYPGEKDAFTNFPFYCIDGAAAPVLQCLTGRGEEQGLVLSHAEGGLQDREPAVRGYAFPYGDTGMVAFGDGLYYFSHHGSNREEKSFFSDLKLYKAAPDGSAEPFTELE